MTWIMVDVEADGPCPGLYSMVSLGAVVVEPRCVECFDTQRVSDHTDMEDCDCKLRPVEPDPRRTFYGQFKPIGDDWIAEALKVSGHTRSEVMKFPDPRQTMVAFDKWLSKVSHGRERPRFVSDNNGFDWQFVNYYFYRFYGSNPFGFSSTNLGSLYKGLVKDMRKNFKHLRKTKHTHHPVDDAKGNAEAMIAMRAEGLKT